MGTTADVKSIREEFQAEWGDVKQKIENYSEESNENLTDLIDKKNKWEGQYEQLNQIRQHQMKQHVAKEEGDINKVEPYPAGQAIKKLYGAKKEALNDLEHLVNAGKDQKIIDEARAGVNVITGKISALKAVRDADQSNQRNTERKQARSLSPNIQTTKTNTKTKSNNFMGTENKVYNKAESVHQEGNGIDINNYFRSIYDEPKTPEEFSAIQNSTTSSGYTLPKEVSTQLIDKLRLENPLIDAGAGTVMLSGAEEYNWVRIKNNPVANFHTELEEEPLDNTDVFDAVKMEPKTLMIVTDVSRELLQDSANAGEAIVKALTGSISDKIVQSSFISQGAKAPEGLDSQVTQTEQFANGGSANIVNVVNSMKTLYDNNVKGENQSAILSPTAWQSMTLEADNNGRYQHQPEPVREMAKFTSSGLAAGEAYVGDFSNVLYGFSMNITVENYSGTTARKFGARFLSAVRFDVKTLLPSSLIRIEESA